MAALNWAMLTPSGVPIPLPQEKLLLTTPSISLSLFPLPPGAELNAQPKNKEEEWTAKGGTLYTSNKRVVFVAPGAGQQGAAGGAAGSAAGDGSLAAGQASIAPGGVPEAAATKDKVPLQTLSVPLAKLVDGRLVQPWFTATYYEAMVMPGEGGGLSEPHLVRFYFKESGGFDFVQTVQEMRDRLELSSRRGRSEMEDLPVYTPSTPAAPPAADNSSLLSPIPTPAVPVCSSSTLSPPTEPPQLSPSPSTLDAARVARAAEDVEDAEREREVERCEGRGRAPPPEPREGEAPPGYDEA
ncbi:hypothetical protein JCM6882_004751 [Rhodosporidiobolus microsporus]